jgi:hypothetical protein
MAATAEESSAAFLFCPALLQAEPASRLLVTIVITVAVFFNMRKNVLFSAWIERLNIWNKSGIFQ